MNYVYILYLKNRSQLYAGITNNLRRRISEHKNNKTKSTTSKSEDPILIYYEAFLNKEDAEKREGYFKTTKGKRSLRLIIRNTLKNIE